MVLVEREGVLRDLGTHLKGASAGRGRLVLLRGEAGVGKTAVVREFVRMVGTDTRVLLGACDPLSTPPPLGPLMDVAPALSTEFTQVLDAALAGAASISGVFRALLAELANAPHTLLVFEDVHWADQATLDLLRYLGRRIQDTPTLLVITYRDDEIGRTHPLTVALGDLAGCPAVHRCPIAPLSKAGVAKLAGHGPANPDELYRVSGGNPFFVTEVLAHPSDAIPATVREAINGRLARLAGPARGVAEAVAAISPPVSLPLLTTVEPQVDTGLEQCLATGVLRIEHTAIEFRHELTRMAVLETVPAYRQVILHQRIVRALSDAAYDADDLARLAYHAEQAGDTAAVLEHAPAAAAHAAALGAHRQAAAHYARALRHARALPTEHRASLLEGLALECFLTNQLTEAINARTQATELRRELGDRLGEGDNLRWLSAILWPVGRPREATETGQHALRVLQAAGPSRPLARAYMNLCQLATWNRDDPTEVAAYAQRTIALGKRFDDPGAIAQARFHSAAARQLRGGDGWAECEQAVADTIASGLEVDAGFLTMLQVWIAVLQRNPTRTKAAMRRAEDYCLNHDLLSYLLVARTHTSRALLNQGKWTEAADTAQAVLTEPSPQPVARALALTVLALVRARRGDPGVWPLLDEATNLDIDPVIMLHLGLGADARAEAAWLDGDDARAQAEATLALREVTSTSDPWPAGALARWMYRAGGTPPVVPTVGVIAEEIAGDWKAAAEAWDNLDCPYDAALARLDGDPPALLQALTTLEALGARPAAARARARLKTLGIRPAARGPRPTTRSNWSGLTPRELEILTMLSQGLSSHNIATRLYISPKTTNHHIEAILAKLGVHSRADAIRTFQQARKSGPVQEDERGEAGPDREP